MQQNVYRPSSPASFHTARSLWQHYKEEHDHVWPGIWQIAQDIVRSLLKLGEEKTYFLLLQPEAHGQDDFPLRKSHLHALVEALLDNHWTSRGHSRQIPEANPVYCWEGTLFEACDSKRRIFGKLPEMMTKEPYDDEDLWKIRTFQALSLGDMAPHVIGDEIFHCDICHEALSTPKFPHERARLWWHMSGEDPNSFRPTQEKLSSTALSKKRQEIENATKFKYMTSGHKISCNFVYYYVVMTYPPLDSALPQKDFLATQKQSATTASSKIPRQDFIYFPPEVDLVKSNGAPPQFGPSRRKNATWPLGIGEDPASFKIVTRNTAPLMPIVDLPSLGSTGIRTGRLGEAQEIETSNPVENQRASLKSVINSYNWLQLKGSHFPPKTPFAADGTKQLISNEKPTSLPGHIYSNHAMPLLRTNTSASQLSQSRGQVELRDRARSSQSSTSDLLEGSTSDGEKFHSMLPESSDFNSFNTSMNREQWRSRPEIWGQYSQPYSNPYPSSFSDKHSDEHFASDNVSQYTSMYGQLSKPYNHIPPSLVMNDQRALSTSAPSQTWSHPSSTHRPWNRQTELPSPHSSSPNQRRSPEAVWTQSRYNTFPGIPISPSPTQCQVSSFAEQDYGVVGERSTSPRPLSALEKVRYSISDIPQYEKHQPPSGSKAFSVTAGESPLKDSVPAEPFSVGNVLDSSYMQPPTSRSPLKQHQEVLPSAADPSSTAKAANKLPKPSVLKQKIFQKEKKHFFVAARAAAKASASLSNPPSSNFNNEQAEKAFRDYWTPKERERNLWFQNRGFGTEAERDRDMEGYKAVWGEWYQNWSVQWDEKMKAHNELKKGKVTGGSG